MYNIFVLQFNITIMSQAISFRPTTSNIEVLSSINNKSEFLNKLIEIYKISKLKKDMIEWFSAAENYDEKWVNFDNKEYFKLLEEQWI